ncbi:DegV family protein [Natronospora cellulosivora (SeqCode)]
MTVKILTDSASDLPKELIEEYSIDVLPLLVTIGDETFLDGDTIKPKELFNGMRDGNVYKTAQVPIGAFIEKFKEYDENTELIYLAFSSELSGTYQGAVMAKEQVLAEKPDLSIDLLDTKCASMGHGMLVYQAAKMASEGKSREEIIEAVDFYKEHMVHIFTVDDLEYLYRGGRVSKTSAFVAGLLNIKPILHVDEGKLLPLEKKKGRKKVLRRMIELINERGSELDKQTVAISHGDDLETAEKVRDMIKDRFGTEDFIISSIGSAVGAHAGPGTIAIFFLDELYPNT